MPVKICYVINNLTIGGAENMLLSTVKKLDKEIFDITVMPLLPGDLLSSCFAKAGVSVMPVGMRHKRDLRALAKLYRFFKRNHVDIVHTHLIEADILGRLAAIFARVPVVLSTEHGFYQWKKKDRTFKSHLRFIVDKFAVRKSTAVIAVAEAIKDYLVANQGTDPQKIYVIKNGIEVTNAAQDLPGESAGNKVVVGGLGRLTFEKGFDRLIDAIAIVLQNSTNIELRIGGYGPLMHSLQTKVDELGLGKHVIFLGKVSDVPGFLKELDVFVMTSHREGIPLSLLEAMLTGLPIIASNVGGIPEVIEDGISGRLVDASNVVSVASAIENLVFDKHERARLGQNARTRVLEEFDLSKKVVELCSLYQQLLEKGHRTRRTGF